MRRFAILGSTARADAGFNLNDVAGTSGRLDVLLRCIRAAMMASHGLREEVVVYLVLGAGPRAPRTVRLDSAGVRFLRPDERSLAVLLRKVLETDYGGHELVVMRPGVSIAGGGLGRVLADAPGARTFVLDEGAPDLRSADLGGEDLLFVVGGHEGIPDADRALLAGAQPLGIGPVSVHADDAIAILVNELDRRCC